jgi:hypothetical protein
MAVQEFFASIGWSIVDPFRSIWLWLVKAVPDIVAAIVILVVGFLVAGTIASLLTKVLNRIKFDQWVFDKAQLSHALGRFDLTNVLAMLTKWYILVLFLGATAARIQLDTLSVFLSNLAMWIPQVIVAVVIGLIGVIAGMYVEKKVTETRAKGAKIVAAVAKWAIYVFTALIVLDQAGVQIALAQNSFMIILGGIVLMVALLVGISFGLAFRGEAEKIIKDVKKKL